MLIRIPTTRYITIIGGIIQIMGSGGHIADLCIGSGAGYMPSEVERLRCSVVWMCQYAGGLSSERLIEVRPGSQMKRDVHGVSVNNPISRELPCPNMKDLGLQFLNLINAERE